MPEGPRISTLFPHLPRADMRSFRLALLGAVAIVVVLALLRLYPLALVAAAVSVPLLFLLYLWAPSNATAGFAFAGLDCTWFER